MLLSGGIHSPGRARFGAVICALLLICLSFSVLHAEAQTGQRLSKSPPAKTEKPKEAQSFLTIVSIEPDAENRRVKIRFNHPVEMTQIQDRLAFYPYIYIQWYESSQDASDAVSIRADFDYGQPYLVTFPEGFTVDRLAYRKTLNEFMMPDLSPKVELLDGRSLIERDSRQMVHLNVVNADRVVLRTTSIPPLLLPFGLGAESLSRQDRKSVLEKAQKEIRTLVKPESPFAPFMGEMREASELYPTAHKKNVKQTYSFPLTFRERNRQGAIELLEAETVDAEPASSLKPQVIRITDLGLSYKRAHDGLLVWTTSIREAKPKAGVSIVAMTRKKEMLYLGKTDENGILMVGMPKSRMNAAGAGQAGVAGPADAGKSTSRTVQGITLNNPMGQFTTEEDALDISSFVSLLAATGDDVSFIDFQPSSALTSNDFTPEPGAWKDRSLLRGEVFTERGVYRPGDEVHFKGIVRGFNNGNIKPQDGGQCTLKIIDSRNNIVVNTRKDLSEFGSAWETVRLEPFRPLGVYTLTMSFGPDMKESATSTFQVQEFRPPRHFARIGFERFTRATDEYVNIKRTEEMIRITISGDYYAGGPVKNGQVRWKIYHGDTKLSVPGFDDYTFGYPSKDEELIETGESLLNESGELVVEFPLDREVLSGKRKFKVVASVIDFDGRAASETADYQADMDFRVGIVKHHRKIEPNRREKLEAIVVDRDGKVVQDGMIQAEVLRRDYIFIPMRNQDGQFDFQYEETWRKQFAANIPIRAGEAVLEFDIGIGGSYLLSFTYRDAKGRPFTSAADVVVGPDFFMEADTEEFKKGFEALRLSSSEPGYRSGDVATIYALPHRPVASMLLTIEQDEVISYRVLSADDIKNGIKVPILETYTPNIYISAVALAPRGEFPMYSGKYDYEAPAVLFGTLRIPVRRDSEPLKIGIGKEGGEMKALPGSEMSLDLRLSTADGTGVSGELAVGVVDEAVLALTGYATPKLDGLMDFVAPLGVLSGEVRTMLLHQTPFQRVRNKALTGGDGDEGQLGLKVRKDFRPVAYFNPSVRTDAEGNARISFTLPDTMTSYRIYVVACDQGSRFGSDERKLTVSKDFYIEPGLPSFFTRGDRFRFPVNVFNNTALQGEVQLGVSSSDNVTLKAGDAALSLAPNKSGLLHVEGEAVRAGEAQLSLRGSLGTYADAVQLKLPVVKGYVFGREIDSGSFTGTASLSLPVSRVASMPWGEVSDEDISAELSLSTSPLAPYSGALSYLLTYPYGCVEQTSSGVIGLAGLRGVIEAGMIPGISLDETDRFLAKGIDRLISMQTSSGAFVYWPGYVQPNPGGTLYAASALSIARKNGFPVPDQAFDLTVNYLRNKIKNREESLEYRAFAAFILSMSDSLDNETLKTVSTDQGDQENLSGLFLLLASHNLRGSSMPAGEQLVRKFLLMDKSDEKARFFNARYFRPALALLAGSAILPQDPDTARAAEALTKGLGKNGTWTSTSDTGWSLYALSRYFKEHSEQGGAARVTVAFGGGRVETVEVDAAKYRTIRMDPRIIIEKPVVTLASDSGRKLYYKAEVTFPRLDYAASGHAGGFNVIKKIENADGSERIRVGDIVKVTVSVQAGKGMKSYVMLDDPLPAGLVAINSAFKTEEPQAEESSLTNGDPSLWSRDGYMRFEPNFFEIREQRVIASRDHLWEGNYRFIYYARAVCEGEFTVPSTKVELMYEPDVNGFTPSRKITIYGRQE